ncbi:cytochrome c oxidase subunit 3 [Pelomicrobium sp. G1]|jgi:cytochrome c oxidase subunit 3|uniref:cytochrome c oxidase subunit 3 n=1 Tax=unclassified Pelomicrobium TaxID=2815318 RepID=UPI000AD82D69|nr:MAG: MFS transporter [Burkholderiales bacterium]
MATQAGGYYLPAPSYWPVLGSTGLFFMAIGAVLLFNEMAAAGWVSLAVGALILIYMMIGWFGTVIRENERGLYNKQVDISFRWAMSWFIFSEVMFFAAFFGALFYMRVLSVPWLGEMDQKLLWPDFTPGWPVAGPGIREQFTPIGAWGIPAINTLLLLSSGVTVTWAHWGLKKNNRSQLIWGLVFTILLGATFLGFQAYEYGHMIRDLNVTLSMGAYGATFFMLTGFHGFHVTIGTIMLIVILGRALAGHFTPDNHFAFEGVSWYWHFVDVVWLLLFVFVYWL